MNFIKLNRTFFHEIFFDLQSCVTQRQVWLVLSLYDIKARYRRTVIGPFWLTLGTAITVFGMGFVWSSIFSMSIKELLPYIAVGIIIWSFIASILNEGCFTFVSQGSIIHNIKTPYLIHVMTFLSKNIIILFHNFFVIIAVFVICGTKINFEILWFIPGLIMLVLNSFWISIVLGICGARYRDISSIVSSITTLIMLATPIMWKTDMLRGNRQFIATLNPFTHMIDIVRNPLLGIHPSLTSYLIIGSIFIVGFSFSIVLYKKYVQRIVFWI